MARIKGPPSRHRNRVSKFLVVLIGGFMFGGFAGWLLLDTFHSFKRIGMSHKQKESLTSSNGLNQEPKNKHTFRVADHTAMTLEQQEEEEEERDDSRSSTNGEEDYNLDRNYDYEDEDYNDEEEQEQDYSSSNTNEKEDKLNGDYDYDDNDVDNEDYNDGEGEEQDYSSSNTNEEKDNKLDGEYDYGINHDDDDDYEAGDYNDGLQLQGEEGDRMNPNDAKKTTSKTTKTTLESTLTKNDVALKSDELFPSTGDTIHVLVTSGGSAYQNFQSRMMYSTYHMVRKLPEGQKLIAFTRILHRVNSDALMKEMPTFHAKPLQPECDVWCAFPPASRPDAVRQFFDAAKKKPSMIKAPWVFMTECDYVWTSPVTAPRAEDTSAKSIAFPFSYIQPTSVAVIDVMEKFYPGGPTSEIPSTGPAPALMRVHEWLSIMPHWERITAEIEEDNDAKTKLGWVREMYAFSIACALENVKLELQAPPHSPLMVQPPADVEIGDAAMLHYTWGSIISDKNGKEVWRFDKREYTDEKWEKNPDKLPEVPPYDAEAGWKLQDGMSVTSELRDTLNVMMKTMNQAIKELPPLT